MDKSLILSAIKSHYGYTKNADFARFLGIEPTLLANWIHRKTFDIEVLISKCDEIEPKWMISGEGNMLKSSSSGVSEPQEEYKRTGDAVVVHNMGVMYVPLVGQYAYAGYLAGFSDPVYLETLPTIPFLIPEGKEPKGKYLAFEVRGDSYDDGSSESVLEGDIVLGRHVKPELYQLDKLHINKWLFVIVHKEEGILLKKIKEHNVQSKTLVLQSLNPMYEDRVMHLSEVSEIYNAVQLLRKPKA